MESLLHRWRCTLLLWVSCPLGALLACVLHNQIGSYKWTRPFVIEFAISRSWPIRCLPHAQSLRLPENQASKLALIREFCSLSLSVNVLGSSSLSHFCSLLWVDLLSVLVVSHSWWGCPVSSAFAGSNTTIDHQSTSLCPNVCFRDIPNYLSVNSTRDTVL